MDQIIAYIEQNRDIYTREAIDGQLVAKGYKPEEVAEAWLIIEARRVGMSGSEIPGVPTSTAGREHGDRRAERPRSSLLSPVFWLVSIGFVALSYTLPGMLSARFPTSYNLDVVVFGILQILAMTSAFIFFDKHSPPAMGLLIGVLISVVVIPCTMPAIFVGICLAVLG